MNVPTLHRGKLARAPTIVAARPLTREDMATLREKRPPQNRARVLRDTHHRVARYVAAGLPKQEIMAITGYSATRLIQLQDDPAFAELVANYRAKVDEAFVKGIDEFYETATDNMRRMEKQVEAHLDAAEEANELIPLKTLGTLIADRADRFGYGKKTTQRNENVDFAALMEQLSRAKGRSNVIDAPRRSARDGDTPGSAGSGD